MLDTPVDEGKRLENILPKSSFDLRHMGQMVDEDAMIDDGGGSMFKIIGVGHQARPNISISWMKGAKAAVAGDSGAGMRASS
jgi:hypothetical protein